MQNKARWSHPVQLQSSNIDPLIQYKACFISTTWFHLVVIKVRRNKTKAALKNYRRQTEHAEISINAVQVKVLSELGLD